MRPVLLLDCDGPMARFGEAYLRLLEEETGYRHAVDEIDGWWIHECSFFKQIAMKCGYSSHRELNSVIGRRISEPGFCTSIEPCPAAQEAVRELASIAEIYVVTSPWASSQTWMYERTSWVAKHFGVPSEHVIHATKKHLVHGDIFVDDKPSHVREWGARWPDEHALLFDMSHNRFDGVGMRRVSWPDVVDIANGRAGAMRVVSDWRRPIVNAPMVTNWEDQ